MNRNKGKWKSRLLPLRGSEAVTLVLARLPGPTSLVFEIASVGLRDSALEQTFHVADKDMI
jgi:hypothetical protein